MFRSAEATTVRERAASSIDWSAGAYARSFARENVTRKSAEKPGEREERPAPFRAPGRAGPSAKADRSTQCRF
jgi:hypothetical protein